jgi:hypothetical protein
MKDRICVSLDHETVIRLKKLASLNRTSVSQIITTMAFGLPVVMPQDNTQTETAN